MKDEEIAGLLVAVLVCCALIYGFIIAPFLEWARQNITTIILISIVIVSILVVGLIFYSKYRKERKEAENIMKTTLFYKVVEATGRFEPSRRYGNEFGYHAELQGWLKSHFPDAKVELQTGSSRPDIVIRDIAIEVKGPTDNQALNTLTTKCLKYSHYYSHLIIVLFEPTFSESNHNEIVNGIKRHFPTVEVIRKQ